MHTQLAPPLAFANRLLLVALGIFLLGITGSEAQFSVNIVGPDDPDFDASFGRINFPGVKEILGVTSPKPNLIMADVTGGAKNTMAYRGSLSSIQNCAVPVTIVAVMDDGSIKKLTGNIQVTKINPSDAQQNVVVKGEDSKLNDLIKELQKTYTVEVVSSNPTGTNGVSEIAIVLRDPKTGKVIPKPEAERIINDLLKGGHKGVDIVKPDCFSKCKDICESVLTIDTSGTIQTAKVPTANSHVFVGMPSKWEQKCGKDAFGGNSLMLCSQQTCKNGGTCNAKPTGPAELCTCSQTNEPTGPSCQLLTRSFTGTSASQSAVTHHEVQPHSSFGSHALTFTFEHASVCNTPGSLCTIVELESGSKKLLKVELGRVADTQYNSATLPVKPPADGKMTLQSDRYVQNKRWMDVTVSITASGGSLKASTVFCSKEVEPTCHERKASLSGSLQLMNLVVSIGGKMNGCFRNVRLNGRLVDLKPSRVSGDASLTKDHCPAQAPSCDNDGACGAQSQCYGVLGAAPSKTCGCRCGSAFRKTIETILKPAQCETPCSSAAPIINTGSSDFGLSWSMQDGSSINLDPSAPLIIELLIRTRQSSSGEVVKVDASAASGSFTILLKIDNEALSVCLDSTCYPFVPVPVNDGYWHSIFMRLARTQLLARVDELSRTHQDVRAVAATGAKVSMHLASSCITNFRLSNIYMPTSSSDATTDGSGTVKVSAGSSAQAKGSCDDPGPACSCSASSETCDGAWGAKTCACKSGFKKPPGGGTCAAPSSDPCVRLGIKCPNIGGKCVQTNGKWQVCQ